MLTTILLYGTALVLLILTLVKKRSLFRVSLKSATVMGRQIVPDILGLLALVAVLLAFLPPEFIRKVLGAENGVLGILAGAGIGSVTIMPAFIAFPLSGSLLNQGADLTAVAAFLTTLTMVGIATFPLEAKTFGRQFATYRNVFSVAAAVAIALGLGGVL